MSSFQLNKKIEVLLAAFLVTNNSLFKISVCHSDKGQLHKTLTDCLVQSWFVEPDNIIATLCKLYLQTLVVGVERSIKISIRVGKSCCTNDQFEFFFQFASQFLCKDIIISLLFKDHPKLFFVFLLLQQLELAQRHLDLKDLMKQQACVVMKGTTFFDLKLLRHISTCGAIRMSPNIGNGHGKQHRLVE